MGVKRDYRLNWILQKLEMRGVVSVQELAKELETSVVTIRKDLETLEQRGKLKKVAGGAVACQQEDDSKNIATHYVGNLELKKAVARKAAELFIRNDDTLIVTSGMTPFLTLVYAEGCTGLKILTESILVAEKLCQRPDYQVILFGGEVNELDAFVYGRDTARQAGRYMADKVIVTMDGVDPKAGLTTLRTEGADTLRAILERARKRIVVADSTKIGKETFCNVGEISLADILVTNPTDDPEKQRLLKQISDAGVEVVFADE